MENHGVQMIRIEDEPNNGIESSIRHGDQVIRIMDAPNNGIESSIRVRENREKKKEKKSMENHGDQMIRIEDEPNNGIESSIREIQEAINNSAFIVIQRRLNEMRRLEKHMDHRHNFRDSDSGCIYRVPKSVKEMSCNAAEPELVSIGPYHRDKPAVQEFENSIKWNLFNSLLVQTRGETGVILQRLVDAMKELEVKARACYSEPICMSHDDFVQMMVIDGGFLIELLQQVCGDSEIRYNSPILMKPGLIPDLTRDLLKLENQIPFFVLERIFNLCIDQGDPLRLLVVKLFSHSLPRSLDPESLKRAADPNCNAKHLLELFHSSYIIPILNTRDEFWQEGYNDRMHVMQRQSEVGAEQTQDEPQLPCSKIMIVLGIICHVLGCLFKIFCYLLVSVWKFLRMIPGTLRNLLFPRVNIPTRRNTQHGYHPLSDQAMQCVTRLRSAGIQFRPRKSADSFLQIKFHKGVLEMPPITINDVTIAALINCVAWEQHLPPSRAHFTAYVAFMNCLINSDRDVTFLCDDGIITSFSLDDKQIAQTFKELGDKAACNIRACYLSKQFKELEAYYGSNWAYLRRTYFRSPWSFISVATAALLLGFTAIQAIMSILSYMNHS